MRMEREQRRPLVGFALFALCCGAVGSLIGCSGGTPEESTSDQSQAGGQPPVDAGEPGDMPVQLVGTLQFTDEESLREGTPSNGRSYSRHFNAQCNFRQPAWAWTNTETGALEFRLREQQPGVLQSDFTGGAEATGDSTMMDLEHTPSFKETSTVRLRGAITQCLIRQLEPAQFGQGQDITLEFAVALQGTVNTSTETEGADQVRSTPGPALPLVLEPTPDSQDGSYHLVNDPSNTGAHLHASPLQLRPVLGARPTGDDPETKLQQEIYDGLAAHPESAWLGLNFDAPTKTWTFNGSHKTGAGAKHILSVKIQVITDPNSARGE